MKHKLISLFAAAVFVISVANLWASAKPFAQYPDNFILLGEMTTNGGVTFWAHDGAGPKQILLNTSHIISIAPVLTFEQREQELRERREAGMKITPDVKRILDSVEVDLVTGEAIVVAEDFEEFYDRVRVSQAK